MYQYIINGGQPLFGEVTISGAKNAAVAIIPAALMVDGVCRIENIPQISDVTLLYTILAGLGITDGKKAVVYPGMEDQMGSAIMQNTDAVADGKIIT